MEAASGRDVGVTQLKHDRGGDGQADPPQAVYATVVVIAHFAAPSWLPDDLVVQRDPTLDMPLSMAGWRRAMSALAIGSSRAMSSFASAKAVSAPLAT
jgi:hypothetical protein